MANQPFVGDRLGKRDYSLATLAGFIFTIAYLIFAPRGLDPALWSDMTVAAGIRPPDTIFPGIWRIITCWLLKLTGSGYISFVLRIAGAIIGGVAVLYAYLIIRQILAYLVRVKSDENWSWIAPLFAVFATIAFGASDALMRIVSPMSPGSIRFLAVLISLHVFLRYIKSGGLWRILLAMFIAGAIAAESPFGFLIPAVYYLLYRLAVFAMVNEQLKVDCDPEQMMLLPRWRMFFAFVAGLVVLVTFNITGFVIFGGLEATQWNAFDLVFRYVIGSYGTIISAASPLAWILAFTFAVLPMIAALVLFPILCRDTEPMRFRIGVILLFAGLLAIVQCGILPNTMLWSFSSDSAVINSDFLECVFMFCTVITVALAGSCFTLGCQTFFMYDADDGTFQAVEPRGYVMRHIVQTVVVVCLVPVLFRMYRPADTQLRLAVHDALVETVRESGDAEFIFTDGRLDAGLELIANMMGSKVKPLNMMSGPASWEKYIRTRHFAEGSPDRDSVEIGVPILLRIWAGETTNGMDKAAVQLGFEFWKRARKPLPKQSGFLAREKGITDADAERGVAVAKNIAARILAVVKAHPHLSISPALKSAVSSVSWRISRFARMRDDEVLANELDEWNDAVKHMMQLIEYERMRTFMQLTPYEGLRLSLRRADFAEARRYATTVLQIDENDPEANFGTGMAYLMEEKYKEAEFYLTRTLVKRPDEPAVINNLSIIFRKTNRLDKALEYAKKAHELVPDNEEVKRTLKETERAISNREKTLKSAFRR